MPTAETWTELLGLHPVVSRARRMGFAAIEKENLIRSLERTPVFDRAEIESLRTARPGDMARLMELNVRVAGLLERISQIETGFTLKYREEMLSGVFAFLAEATGLPKDSIRGLFSNIEWTSPGLADVVAGGGLLAPVRRTVPQDVQTPERKRLLALIAKRITHDLIIHGMSLRFFYQSLPLLRDTLDRNHPGLTNLYIGFAASLQLMMLLYEGPFPDGAAVRAGRVEVGIRDKTFRIRISGINFPSLFNEIAKGLYEALLHPGMPTAQDLGADESIFRELTSGPDLEYELQKVAPEASLRMHQSLLACRNSDPQRIGRILASAGFVNLSPEGEVSMLYRAFARLEPVEAALFACRSFTESMKGVACARLFQKIIDRLED